MSITAIVDHLAPMDGKGKRRSSRPARWYAILVLVAFSGYAGRDYFNRAVNWFVKVDTHIEVHSPKGYERLQTIESAMGRVDERTGRLETSMTRIEDALIRRGLADARTPAPTAAPVEVAVGEPFRGCPGCASADDGAVGPGLPRRVPAARGVLGPARPVTVTEAR